MALPNDADIVRCLQKLGIADNVAPDTSSYEAMAATWRGSVPCPTEAEMETAWVDVQADIAREEAARELSATDVAMARVVEDLLDVLDAKGVITAKDLPQAAQDKIETRKTLRSKL